MGIWDFFKPAKKERQPQDLSLSDFSTAFGLEAPQVSTAVKSSLVWACSKIVSEAVASLPCQVYYYNAKGERELASFFREYNLLQSSPNDLMTAFAFKQAIVQQLLFHGNAYILKDTVKNPDGTKYIVDLTPLDPEKVTVKLSPNGMKLFEVQGFKGALTTESIIHIVGNTLDGVVGIGVLQYQADALGMTSTLNKFTRKYFKNSANPGGIISAEGDLKDVDIATLKASWSAEFSSVENTGKVPVLPKGFKYTQLSLNAKDAMLIEALNFNLQDIARVFGVPPSRLGDLSKTSYASQEQDDISFLKYTILPWLKRIENALTVGLFASQGSTAWVEFNADAFLRTTTLDRYNAYNIALQAGWATRNEVRKRENLKPLPGLDQIYIPLNQGTPAQAASPKAKRKADDAQAELVFDQKLD